jgi:hypothetical protein
MNVRIECFKAAAYECVAEDVNTAIDRYITTRLGFNTGFSLSAPAWETIKSSITDNNTRVELVNGLCKNPFNKITRIISNFTVAYPNPLPALTVPIVSISEDGLASWPAVENATGYTYIIQGATSSVPATTRSVQLSANHSIVVKALGDNLNCSDSEYSAVATYTVVE